MTDIELLELAANAAGVEGKLRRIQSTYSKDYFIGIGKNRWNPLESDADALRLAVKLKLNIHNSAHSPSGIEFIYAQAKGKPPQQEWQLEDPCAATRRAIVRAAATIRARSE